MEFRLGYPARAALHGLATRLLDEPPRDCVATGQPTGLAARFATECRTALGQGNDPSALREAITRLDLAIGQSVHPRRRCRPGDRCCSCCSSAIAAPGRCSTASNVRCRRSCSCRRHGAACSRLDPPQPLLALWLPRFAELAQDHPNLPGMAPCRGADAPACRFAGRGRLRRCLGRRSRRGSGRAAVAHACAVEPRCGRRRPRRRDRGHPATGRRRSRPCARWCGSASWPRPGSTVASPRKCS